MKAIDGAFGEGGGQILRTSLALSLVTGTPFRIERIRANRKKPGLRNQHLAAVNAAAQVGKAEVEGNSIGSCALTFVPTAIAPGSYHFSVGTAGSSTLVLQTILPALMTAAGHSDLVLEGGTHNPLAPPFDFLSLAFLPIIRTMGPDVSVRLERPGFYPAGGGRFSVAIEPAATLSPITLPARGDITRCIAKAIVAKLPRHIGERELNVVSQQLSWDKKCLHREEFRNSRGPGNVLILIIESQEVTEVFTGFGERGVPAEKVATRVIAEVREYLEAEAPVGPHLADQLLIPMALAGGGTFRTSALTQHTLTNIDVIKHFLDLEITTTQLKENCWEIALRK